MKDNTKISADDLPWYLRESLDTTDVDELDQNSLTFSRYTGSLHTENAIVDESMEESSSQPASNFNSSARREKRPRTTFEYDNNPHFIPFTGTSEELIEFSKSDEASSENISNFSFVRILEERNLEHAALLTTTISVLMCILRKFRRRKLFSQSSSQKSPRQQLNENSDTDKSVVTDDHLKLEILPMVSEDSADMRLNDNTSVSKYDIDAENILIEYNELSSEGGSSSNESSISMPNQENCFNDNFQKDISNIAAVLTQSGLNDQDSLRIATEEYFAARRRSVEEAKKSHQEKLRKVESEAKSAEEILYASIASVAIRQHMLVCIGIGCAVRLLVSNRNDIFTIFKGADALDDNIGNNLYRWIQGNLCGCQDSVCPQSMINTNQSSVPKSLDVRYAAWNAFYYYTGIGTTANTLPFPLSILSLCTLQYTLCFILLAGIHKILKLFHCIMLHHCLNIVILGLILIKSIDGDAAVSICFLILRIMAYNWILCGISHYQVRRFKSQAKKKSIDPRYSFQHSNASGGSGSGGQRQPNGTRVELHEKSVMLMTDIRRKMFFASVMGTIL
eukprot:CAMPEP_0194115406 /NCGR_PEP_ID=MMETSP0150-20130528/23525_1 /TAXON_ID=122233 /ORGANISM="Chaetoceros debilis, Strain MM31A-1" /LENGTH=563 /DNA_ID=CAMNT_0038805897 /DNA_START=178 /DNA_END=1865 /DNA_ORIENTATION=+